jgi:hypothetical protein
MSYISRRRPSCPATVLAVLLCLFACTQETPPYSADIPIVKQDYITNNNPNNSAPTLSKIGDRSLVLGQTATITLEAFDSDQDVLVFSVFGNLPNGAKFDKSVGRFDWTPNSMGPPIYLTFQVSDGQDVDRETVKFTVSSLSEPSPPVFEKVSDQVVQGGTFFTIGLVATDPNGDQLLFGVEGVVPEEAALDPANGQFSWNIPESLIGTTQRIHFTVTDGQLTDEMPLNFVITSGASGPSPPIFTPTGPFEVDVDQPLSFQLNAVDPNQDVVHYGFDGMGPPGASINPDTGLFQWTPAEIDAGKTFAVVFFASDGTLKAYLEVQISVFQFGAPASCVDDFYEPNNLLEQAASIGPGYYNDLSICDNLGTSSDSDWFLVQTPPGKTLSAILSYDPNGQPLSLFIVSFGLSGIPEYVATAQGSGGQLLASYKNVDGALLYIQVDGSELEKYAQNYSLTVEELDTTTGCTADIFDANFSNNEPNTATFVETTTGTSQLDGLTICEGDVDWYSFNWSCGQTADVSLSFDSGLVDLDLYLYKANETEIPIDTSAGLSSPETVNITGITESGSYLVRVIGYPATASGQYSLHTNINGGTCPADSSEPNDSTSASTQITTSTPLNQQTLCCDDDYYRIGVAPGETLTVSVAVQAGTGTVEFYPSMTSPPFAVDTSPIVTQSGSQIELSWQSIYGSLVYVRVFGSNNAGNSYSISATLEESAGQTCTDLSCPLYQVCDPGLGCVSDFCENSGQCPAQHVCVDTYCVNPCSTDQDCRVDLEYSCKQFGMGDHCARYGTQTVGESCDDFKDCSGYMVCLFQAYGGYCTIAQCGTSVDCPSGASCYWDSDFTSFCGKNCSSNLDCRVDEGYSCQTFGSAIVCAP